MSTAARGLTAVTTETRRAAAGLLIERPHQLALGQPHQVGAVDDVVEMACDRRAAAGELRGGPRYGEKLAHDRARTLAIVGGDHVLGTSAQLLDGGEARQSKGFARRDRHEGKRSEDRKRKPDAAEQGGARRQVLDEVR